MNARLRGLLLWRETHVERFALRRHVEQQLRGCEPRPELLLELLAQFDELLGAHEVDVGQRPAGKRREDYVLSSKVGKLFKASKHNRHDVIFPFSDSPNDVTYDY